jgi:hypothetical protein
MTMEPRQSYVERTHDAMRDAMRDDSPVGLLADELDKRRVEAAERAHDFERQARDWPERGDEKCIVFLQDGERGGLQLHGYEEDADAIGDLFVHLRALFEANGMDLQLHALGRPVGRG